MGETGKATWSFCIGFNQIFTDFNIESRGKKAVAEMRSVEKSRFMEIFSQGEFKREQQIIPRRFRLFR